MAELPGQEWIPVRAQPRFGRGAFRGSVAHASTPKGDIRYANPDPFSPPVPFPVTPVNVTSFSAGNQLRLGVVGMLFEWWNWRSQNSGAIFVSNPASHTRVVARRMSRVRRLDHLVANRRVIYDAPSYGPQGDATGAGLPSFDYRRR